MPYPRMKTRTTDQELSVAKGFKAAHAPFGRPFLRRLICLPFRKAVAVSPSSSGLHTVFSRWCNCSSMMYVFSTDAYEARMQERCPSRSLWRSVDRPGDREGFFFCERNPYALSGKAAIGRSHTCSKCEIPSEGRLPRGFRYRPFREQGRGAAGERAVPRRTKTGFLSVALSLVLYSVYSSFVLIFAGEKSILINQRQ